MANKCYGRREVLRLEQAFQSKVDLVNGAQLDEELNANYARYLCVLLAGFAEQSLKALLTEHARKRSNTAVHRYVELNVDKLWGIDQKKLQEMLDSFDPSWFVALEESMVQELSTLQSVGKLRNNISHGGDAGITLLRMKQYSTDIVKLMRKLCDILDPVA